MKQLSAFVLVAPIPRLPPADLYPEATACREHSEAGACRDVWGRLVISIISLTLHFKCVCALWFGDPQTSHTATAIYCSPCMYGISISCSGELLTLCSCSFYYGEVRANSTGVADVHNFGRLQPEEKKGRFRGQPLLGILTS